MARKMLRPILGQALVERTYRNAKKSALLADVIVACDHEEIRAAVEGFGGKALLTALDHTSGTSRIAEVARSVDADVVINIQGDEPLMSPLSIDRLARAFQGPAEFHVATLAIAKSDEADYRNPNVVKVVRDRDDFALYFSRSPLPFYRDRPFSGFLKHLGIYAYTRHFLTQLWSGLAPSELEENERLEQLRILDNGYKIKVLLTEDDSVGVDTEEDLKKVEAILRESESCR
ncbi:MAG: 3-deoxy-manno-octulosonate cytidylyltransferase [Candidatus Omnitrophica bacterium]|nr:3-deoxy-manno-octulosonate cytidylyltransferase [Candidatus Omnitrophota bacterium]